MLQETSDSVTAERAQLRQAPVVEEHSVGALAFEALVLRAETVLRYVEL